VEVITITDHAYERAKERCGWNKNALDRMAEKVMVNGINHNKVSGQLKRYIDKIYLQHRNASAFKIYGAYLFIFSSDKLITVYKLPNNVKQKKERK